MDFYIYKYMADLMIIVCQGSHSFQAIFVKNTMVKRLPVKRITDLQAGQCRLVDCEHKV